MEKKLLSLIIPIYKVSDYIDKCIDSVVNQTYSNLQIILVDDGSPDDCGIKSDNWAKNDERITVIHKSNGGLSDARNHGMKIAVGDYIGFIDSDDYIANDFSYVMLSTALEHDSDIVECDVVKFYETGEYEEYHDNSFVSDYSTLSGLSALIDENPFHQYVWDKLYKREVIKKIYFEVGKQHEDEFWTYQIFGQAKRITKIYRTMYFYLQRETSIMGNGCNLRRLDALEGKWNRQRYIEKYFPELALMAKLDFFGSCIYLLQCVLEFMSGEEKKQAIAIIRKYKKMSRITFNDIKNVSDSTRKYYFLAKINIYLCCRFRVLRGVC